MKIQVTGNQSTAGIFGTLPAHGVNQASLFMDQVLSTALLLIGICSLSNKRNKFVANAQIPLAVGFIIVAIGVAFGKKNKFIEKKAMFYLICFF